MVNEPMPWSLTVGQLREALHGVPDQTVVCLTIPEWFRGLHPMVRIVNLRALPYPGGPVLRLEPMEGPPADPEGR